MTRLIIRITINKDDEMKSYSSREVIQIIKKDGWHEVACDGSHHHFKHPVKKGKTTVKHPQKNIPITTLKRIEKQSGINFSGGNNE